MLRPRRSFNTREEQERLKMLQQDRNFTPSEIAQTVQPPKGLLSQTTTATQGSSGAESAFNNILNTATTTPIATPTNPSIGNTGPVQAGTNAANPDYAAGMQGDSVGGIGNTAGMGQDINYSTPITQNLSVGDVFSTSIGDYVAVDNGSGQIGLQALDGAAQGPSSIIYNMAYDGNTVGVNPNTGEAWNQTSTGLLPGLTDTGPANPEDTFNNLLGTTGVTEQQGQQGGEASTASQDTLSNLLGATSRFTADDLTVVEPNIDTPTTPFVDPNPSSTPVTASTFGGNARGEGRVDVQEIASQIEGFYQQYLGRKSDKAGLDYWVNSALNGRSLDQIRADIANSAESVGRANNLVTQAYQQLLGRDPQQEGLDYWRSGLLQGGTLDALYYNIRQSPEFEGRATDVINSAFSEFVERPPAIEELAGFLQAAKDGTSLEDITAQIQALAPPTVIDDGSMAPADPGGSGPADPAPADPAPAGPPTTPTPDAPNEPSQTSTDQAAEEARQAESQDAEVTGREVTPEQLVQYQLNRILDSNSPLLQSARTRGLQFANRRGLLNSSIAAQASEQAAIDAALQIAQQDAATYAGADAQTVDAMNRAALQDASLGTNVNIVNADSANTAIQGFLNRESQRALQDDAQLFTAEQNQADRELRQYLQERQFDFTSTENALDRGLQEALQQNQFAFQSEESKLDRALRTALQESQFEFTGDQNALDRALRQQLQNEQLTWTGTQNELDRVLQDSLTRAQISSNESIANAKIRAQQALQEAQFDFSAGQAALDREFQSAQLSAQQAFQSLEAQKSRDFNAWSQTYQNDWAAAQNDLDREFKKYQVNAQTASAIMYSTMDGIAAVYADPNLTSAQKTQAAANIINQSLQMPGLLTNINERMDPDYVPPEGGNPGPGDPGYVPGPGEPGYIPPNISF